ncbi:hypothetical protein ACIP2X_38045 [Streptomyces sp. NPDC089424]|uniref:hypothetical protein n=1 Tax=Streptomyces sp. NPDC089424 TaxID=3365917 RepID=UPI003809E44C
MALTEQPGTYWHDLAADQQAGTYRKCRCGELNPATYDICYSCQTPIPDHSPHPQTGQPFTPTGDDMEGEYAGALVASLGEDGDAIAVTGDKRQALEAIDSYCRHVCGRPNLLDDATRPLTDAYFYLDSGHALFTRTADGGWTVTPVAEDAPGAVPVTWFEGGVYGPVPEPYARRSDPKIW